MRTVRGAEELTLRQVKRAQRFLEIFREGRFEVQFFPGGWMNESQFPGVEHLARSGVAGEGFKASVLFGSINIIPDQWVADVLEVDADLMGTPGMKAAFDERGGAETFNYFKRRPRIAGVGAVSGSHAFAVRGMSRDADLYFAAFDCKFATDDGAIDFRDAALFELRGKI